MFSQEKHLSCRRDRKTIKALLRLNGAEMSNLASDLKSVDFKPSRGKKINFQCQSLLNFASANFLGRFLEVDKRKIHSSLIGLSKITFSFSSQASFPQNDSPSRYIRHGELCTRHAHELCTKTLKSLEKASEKSFNTHTKASTREKFDIWSLCLLKWFNFGFSDFL